MHTSNYSLQITHFQSWHLIPYRMYYFIFVQFAQLIRIQKKLGKENFPLVEQAYYPNHREMVSNFKYRILYIYHQILLGVLFPVASHSILTATLSINNTCPWWFISDLPTFWNSQFSPGQHSEFYTLVVSSLWSAFTCKYICEKVP